MSHRRAVSASPLAAIVDLTLSNRLRPGSEPSPVRPPPMRR
ncbi:hypothetical protein [Streptomyces sp. NPDC047042]